MSYKEINALRKEGNLSQALAMAETEFADQPDKHSAVALFWCLNTLRKETDQIDQSKIIIERMAALWEDFAPDNVAVRKTVEVARQSLTAEAIAERKAWRVFKAAKEAQTLEDQKKHLFEYLKMDNPRPSLLHSLVLQYAVRLAKNYAENFNLAAFVDLWRLDLLRTEDWDKVASSDGILLPSTIEQLLSALSKELLRSRQLPSPTISMLLEQALDQYPENNHLARYKAQFTALSGDKDNAIAMYRSLVSQHPDVFYLWDELSDLADDSDVRTGLLCVAASCPINEDYLPKIRLKLAADFIDYDLYDNAKTELDLVAETYQRNNWTLPPAYAALAADLPDNAEHVDNALVYVQYKAYAYRYIYADASTEILIKLKDVRAQYNGKPMVTWQMRGQDGMIWVNPRKFCLDFRSPKGAVYKACIVDNEVKSIEPAQLPTNLSWARKVDGVLTIKEAANGKRFGFVEGVFVTGTMLAGHSNGDYVSVLAVLNPDNRWGAILIH